jgi:subtilisin family serine protease
MISGCLAIATLHVAAVAVDAQPAQPAPIEPGVLEQLARGPQASFWVVMVDQADLSAASDIRDWDDRGTWVYERLHSVSEASMTDLRPVLERHGASYRRFWIVNAVHATGDRSLVDELAAHPTVARIADRVRFSIPEPVPSDIQSTDVEGVEWNVASIGAPEVWSTLGATGEGIVVANIDTGVQFDHPALVGRYRGSIGGSQFDHDYNWFDPSNVCGDPSTAPCDNHGHGTHTMGTMVGDDLVGNRIGVAPGARWIAAKGCETNTCSDAALLASAQWILAPTDLYGDNPRPDLRPHVVNNSWGGSGGREWFMGFVDAWIAAGIFPQFSNGNAGPACNTSGSPGDYPQSYSAGAVSDGGVVASFSSRGPSHFSGTTKPDIAAPGVNVRSSVPTNAYAVASGTSMASPHVAGTVALMWSAAPVLVGDTEWTRDILDASAVDVGDLTCGGTLGDNNVYGEGRLDAFAAVDQSPVGPTAVLSGTVRDADTGNVVAGGTVHAAGVMTRTTITDADGEYSMLLGVATYTVTATAFGYGEESTTVEVPDAGARQDFALTPAPRHRLDGTVRDTIGEPVIAATVTILGTPMPAASTDADGSFTFTEVPTGTYQLYVEAGRCTYPATAEVTIDSDRNVSITLSVRSDAFGHGCRLEQPTYIPGDHLVLLGDDAQVEAPLAFPFPFYGDVYTTVYIAANGFIHFEPSLQTSFYNAPLPQPYLPNAAIYAFWDNLVFDPLLDPECGVWTAQGSSDQRDWFLVEWRHATFFGDTTRRIDVEVVIFDDGEILAQYRDIEPDGRERGDGAVFGLENQNGTAAFQYAYRSAVIRSPEMAIRYVLLPMGAVHGTVVDSNDGEPIVGAEVVATDDNGNLIRTDVTDAGGGYRFSLPVGTYAIRAMAPNYTSAEVAASVDFAGDERELDLSLDTGLPDMTPSSLTFEASGADTLYLENAGSATLTWSVAERVGGRTLDVRWLDVSPRNGSLEIHERTELAVSVDASSLLPGTYVATLVLSSDAGRVPTLEIPVTLAVGSPGVSYLVNCGGATFVDNDGAQWRVDQAYTSGSWGYTDRRARTRSTDADIAGTDDDPIFQSFIRRPGSYRFDQLPDGTYILELSFAESEPEVVAGDRVFDVSVASSTLLDGYDIAATVGRLVADRPGPFTVRPAGGTIEIQFPEARRSLPAIVNGIRLVQIDQ